MNPTRSSHCLRLLLALAALAAPAVFAQSATGGNPRDYSAFKIVADRNIFDPNRYPHSGGRPVHRQTKTTDAFSLVGVMSYNKGIFAFFDGTSSDYRKVLKPADSIAGFTLVEVTPDKVRLSSGTNAFTLPVGSQMRFAEGQWDLNTNSAPASGYSGSASGAAGSAADNSAPASASESSSSSSGNASDVLKRLMQRRQQQLNR